MSSSTTTTSSPLDLPLTDASLQQRLALGVTSQTGARGSLTRCAVLLLSKAGNTTTTTASSSKAAVVRELKLAQMEMNKLYSMIQRCEHELQCRTTTNSDDMTRTNPNESASSSSSLEATLQAETQGVQELRRQLARAQAKQSRRQEYEAAATIVLAEYPTGSRWLSHQLALVETQLAETRHKLQQAQSEFLSRQAQVQNLLQSLFDLRKSLLNDNDDVLLLEDGEMKMNVEVDHKVIGQTEMAERAEDMQMEEDEEDKDEEDLYTDL
jgi:hypothetical protein